MLVKVSAASSGVYKEDENKVISGGEIHNLNSVKQGDLLLSGEYG